MDIEYLLESTSSSSSSEGEEFIEMVHNVIIPELLKDNPKNEIFVEETVPLYREQQFIEHFRLPRRVMDPLVVQFENSRFYKKKDTGHQRITTRKCILAFLWFASNEAAGFRDVADRFNLALSTTHDIVDNVVQFVSNLSPQVIVWPSVEECRAIIAEHFNEMGFPGIIGCIDGTHIRINTPPEDPESYLNRNKFYSIHVQIVCDYNRKIRDVFIGYPGSVHDARVFRNSSLGANMGEKCGEFVILGDSAYPCLRNLLTAYKDMGNLTNIEKRYNKKLSHCRVLVEHTIGLLKQRFRQLYHMNSRNVQFICHFIRACCVLHNMCIDNDVALEINDETPDEHQEDAGHETVQKQRNDVGINYMK